MHRAGRAWQRRREVPRAWPVTAAGREHITLRRETALQRTRPPLRAAARVYCRSGVGFQTTGTAAWELHWKRSATRTFGMFCICDVLLSDVNPGASATLAAPRQHVLAEEWSVPMAVCPRCATFRTLRSQQAGFALGRAAGLAGLVRAVEPACDCGRALPRWLQRRRRPTTVSAPM